MKPYQRGDVVIIDVPMLANSHIQAGKRPWVVVQNNVGNQFSSTSIVVPLTTKIKRLELPTHVAVTWGSLQPSMVECELMLYNFNGTLLNTADIVTVSTSKGQRAEYPFVLTVAMRNGQQFAVSYRNEIDRTREVNEIARAFDRSVVNPVTRYEVESIVEKYIRKVRADFRPLKKFVKESAENG